MAYRKFDVLGEYGITLMNESGQKILVETGIESDTLFKDSVISVNIEDVDGKSAFPRYIERIPITLSGKWSVMKHDDPRFLEDTDGCDDKAITFTADFIAFYVSRSNRNSILIRCNNLNFNEDDEEIIEFRYEPVEKESIVFEAEKGELISAKQKVTMQKQGHKGNLWIPFYNVDVIIDHVDRTYELLQSAEDTDDYNFLLDDCIQDLFNKDLYQGS